MKKLLIIASLFFVAALGVNAAHAQQSGSTLWITGKVMSIEEGKKESLVSLDLGGGEYFNVAAANNLLRDIKVGDVVTVQMVKGWAEMVEIAEGEAIPITGPEKSDKGLQWVAGRSLRLKKASLTAF
jgi:hypothetical protein